MSSRRERRKMIRKSRALAHKASCERGHWKAQALLLGFYEAEDSQSYQLVVAHPEHNVHFADMGKNPWKLACDWWEKERERKVIRDHGTAQVSGLRV